MVGRVFSLLLCLFCCTQAAYGQSKSVYLEDTISINVADSEAAVVYPPQMSAEDWKGLVGEKFPYAEEREQELRIESTDSTPSGLQKLFAILGRFFSSSEGKWLIWSLVVVFVLYALWKLVLPEFRLFRRRRSVSTFAAVDNTPEEATLSDNPEWQIDVFLQAADYRNATRIVYLIVLRSLAEQGWIQQRSDSTDFDYYRALPEGEVKVLFRRLLIQYQYAWFGAFPVSEKQWEETQYVFVELKSKLRS